MKRCYQCMSEKLNENRCLACGHVNLNVHDGYVLKPGTILSDRYYIGNVVGQGGFGITYVGYDEKLELKVAIKEYFPVNLATRKDGFTEVKSYSDDKSVQYRFGLERFLNEAKVMAKFNQKQGIVSVMDYFEANGTGYLVMEYLEGMTLETYLKNNGGQLDVIEARSIVKEILRALISVHKAEMIHRDISPDNIYMTDDKQVKILDLGAARYALSEKTNNLTVVLKRGYAPAEQYSKSGNQGPWTDVYSVGATWYQMLTGMEMTEAMSRSVGENYPLPSEKGVKINVEEEAVLIKALEYQPEDRYQSAEAFVKVLHDVSILDETIGDFTEMKHKDEKGRKVQKIKVGPVVKTREIDKDQTEIIDDVVTMLINEPVYVDVKAIQSSHGKKKKGIKRAVIIGMVAVMAIVIGIVGIWQISKNMNLAETSGAEESADEQSEAEDIVVADNSSETLEGKINIDGNGALGSSGEETILDNIEEDSEVDTEKDENNFEVLDEIETSEDLNSSETEVVDNSQTESTDSNEVQVVEHEMTMSFSQQEINADGSDSNLVAVTLLEDGKISSVNAELSIVSTYGAVNESISMKNGEAEFEIISEFLTEDINVFVTVTVTSSTDNDWVGYTISDSFKMIAGADEENNQETETNSNDSEANLINAEAISADCLTIYLPYPIYIYDYINDDGTVNLNSCSIEIREGTSGNSGGNAVAIDKLGYAINAYGEDIPNAIKVYLDIDENIDNALNDNSNIYVSFTDKVSSYGFGEMETSFYFDDNEKPSIVSVNMLNMYQLQVTFSEAVLVNTGRDIDAKNLSNWKIDGIALDNNIWGSENTAEISFYGDYMNREYILITLGKNDLGEQLYLSAGEHSIEVANIGDYAALTDSNNVSGQEFLDYIVNGY